MRMFVYGHLDSRGGHTGVIAPDRATADKMYAEKVFLQTDPDFVAALAESDFAFVSDVQEDLWPEGENDEGDWRVLVEAKYAELPFPWSHEDFACHPGCTPETCSDSWANCPSEGLVKLMRIESDKPAPEGFAHVRWNDDAFGFLVVK